MLTRDEAAALFERRRRAWLAGDIDAYLELFDESMTFQSPMHGVPLRGRGAFAELVRRSFEASRPLSFDFSHLAVEGESVLAEWRIAIERRDSGERITWDGMSRCAIRDGRITDWREIWNPADLGVGGAPSSAPGATAQRAPGPPLEPAQRFNHVAVTVPPNLLDAPGQEALVRFYGEVFGWTEMPTMAREHELLVLRVCSNEQFVFIQASSTPMRGEGNEHFGVSVATPAELEAILERARSLATTDGEVEVRERTTEDYGAVKLHSFYVRYRLPLLVEVQCFEWAPGFGPQSTA